MEGAHHSIAAGAERRGIDQDREVLVTAPSAGRDVLEADAGNRTHRFAVDERNLVTMPNPFLDVVERGQRNRGMWLGEPSVEPCESRVVVTRVAVIAGETEPCSEVGIVGGDQPTFGPG